MGEPWPVAVAGLPRRGELLSGGHRHRWSFPAAVSTVTVPTTPLFSKKLSNSSSAASMDTSTPEPLPGRAGVSPAPGELGPPLVPPGAGRAALLPRGEAEAAREPDAGRCQADPRHGRHPHGAGERGHADHHGPRCHAGPRGTGSGTLRRHRCSAGPAELLSWCAGAWLGSPHRGCARASETPRTPPDQPAVGKRGAG